MVGIEGEINKGKEKVFEEPKIKGKKVNPIFESHKNSLFKVLNQAYVAHIVCQWRIMFVFPLSIDLSRE
ncbi:hypothetical protein EPI10_031434 [Gossypium australe]|uniref:Uncharacterized protein n=1 Tax=Gossypium australe TaxID=47621 RepID=A0A5B6X0B5_9ROSI|nr:hypothetical protein EPI10_031434 [Gossypium australe]